MTEYRREHRRDVIKAQPLDKVQEAFVKHAFHGTLDEATRDALIRSLEATLSDDATRNYYTLEKDNVEAALKAGKAPRPPSIALPETSLLWAINLAHLAQKKGDTSLYDTELWKQFAGNDGAAQTEKEWLSFYIASTGVNNETRLKWGELGSTFYFDPEEKCINIDLILALGVGFDVARAVALHEIAHSHLTKGFGEKIDVLDEQINTLLEKKKTTKLTDAEKTSLRRMDSERKFRYYIMDEAENNPMDRWVVNQGPRIRKDHVLARNKAEATLVDGLLDGQLDTVNDNPNNRFRNVKHTIRNSFFRNNGYMPDTEAGWREVGINPDWITTKDGKSGMEALEILKELCGGKDGVENLQPNSDDMMYGPQKLEAAILDYSRKRNKRIEEIYDRFVAHVVEPLLDQPQKQDQREQKSNDPQQDKEQGTPQQGDGQEAGEPQEGDGQGKPDDGKDKEKGESQPGQGEGAEEPQEGEGEGKSDSGKGKGKGQSQSGDGEEAGESQEGEGRRGKPGDGKDKEKGESQAGQGEGTGEPQEGDEKGKSGSGKKSSQAEDDISDIKSPPKTPHEAHNANKPGANKPTEGKNPDAGQSIDELDKARKEREKREREQNGGDPGASPASPHPGQGQGFRPARGVGQSNVESKPLVGDWSDYQKMKVEFSPEIRQRQVRIDQLRKLQREKEDRVTPERTLLPIDGDMRRLDRNAHATLLKKILHDRTPTEDDAKRFNNDQKAPIPSNMDVVLLIDGSGSMHADRSTSGVTWPFPPIKAGMHAGCVLNEACRGDVTAKRHTNFYMGLWGNDVPLMLVKPTDKDDREIGKRIAGVKESQGWGTSLAPSIRHATQQLIDGQKAQTGANAKTGYSHIIVMSDGGIADANASFLTISKLLENCPLVSVDFVVIENEKTDMDALAKKLEAAFPGRVGVQHHQTTATVSDGMEMLLQNRIRNTPVTQAVSRDSKRGSLTRAYNEMTTR